MSRFKHLLYAGLLAMTLAVPTNAHDIKGQYNKGHGAQFPGDILFLGDILFPDHILFPGDILFLGDILSPKAFQQRQGY